MQVYMYSWLLSIVGNFEDICRIVGNFEDIIDKEKKEACFIVIGDWTVAVEGKDGKIMGIYGAGKINERGELLTNFCKENFIIGNTLYIA